MFKTHTMTITQLQYVLAVAEHKNFTKAAKHCYVTQPTLSMQIQKLEEELDILIFDRNQKPIGLTPVGSKIVEQARKIVNESERMQDVVDQEKGYIGGVFYLGIIPTVMPTLLPFFLKTFSKRYPKVHLKIEELNTDEIITRIEDGYLDAAIAATPLEHEKIKERPLYYEPFVGYIPSGHSLASISTLQLEDLNPEEILLLKDGHCLRENIINLCQASTAGDSDFQLKSGSIETLIKLSDEGLGMTLLPYLHTLDLSPERAKNLRSFKEPSPAREISLIYSDSQLKSHITDALYSTISAVVRGAIAFHDVKIISPLKK